MSLIEQFYSLPNISLGAVPIAGVLAALPHWFAVALAQRKKTNPPFDVSNPRVWVQGLNYRAVLERTGQQAGKKLAAHEWLVIQAEAAQANAFEHLPLFAVALLTGTVAGLPAPLMNGVAANYLIMRIVFNFLYLYIQKGQKGLWRTLVFQIMYLPLYAVFVQSAIAFAQKKA